MKIFSTSSIVASLLGIWLAAFIHQSAFSQRLNQLEANSDLIFENGSVEVLQGDADFQSVYAKQHGTLRKWSDEPQYLKDSLIIEKYNDKGEWELYEKSEYSYDDNLFLDLSTTYRRNIGLGVWEIKSTQDSDNDENGNLLNFVYQRVIDNKLTNSSRRIQEFNTNRNVTSADYYVWDTEQMIWAQNQRTEYEYDSNGIVVLETWYQWYVSGSKELDSKAEFVNSDDGLKMSVLSYDWIDNDWVLLSKTDYQHDENDMVTSRTRYDWNDDYWTKSSRAEYMYNNSGQTTFSASYNWDFLSGSWIGKSKEEYDFGKDGFMSEFRYFIYEDGIWVNTSKSEFINTDNGDVSEFHNYNWDEESSAWEYGDHYLNYYSFSEEPLQVKSEISSLSIYPNPAQTNFSLSEIYNVEQVLILDIQGREVLEFGHMQENYDISPLMTGVYTVHVIASGQTHTMRLLKN